jgi:Mn-dependent DtxR family transcriptional regulator
LCFSHKILEDFLRPWYRYVHSKIEQTARGLIHGKSRSTARRRINRQIEIDNPTFNEQR